MTNNQTSVVGAGDRVLYSGHDLDQARRVAYASQAPVLLRYNGKIIFSKS